MQSALTQTFTQITNRSEYKACTVHWHKPLSQTTNKLQYSAALLKTLHTNYQQSLGIQLALTQTLHTRTLHTSYQLDFPFCTVHWHKHFTQAAIANLTSHLALCTDTNPTNMQPYISFSVHSLLCVQAQYLHTNYQQVWVHNLQCAQTQTSHTNYQQTWVHSCTGTDTSHKLSATIAFGTERHTHYRQW